MFLEMKPSADGVSQARPGKDCDEGDDNDCADGKDDRRPCEAEGQGKVAFDEKFDAYTDECGFYKEIQSGHQKRRGDLSYEEGKNERGNRTQSCDGQRQSEKPFLLRGVETYHEFIQCDGKAVTEDGAVKRHPCIDNGRNCKNPDDDAGADDIERPQGLPEYEEV